jgi:single-stranded-DNA-specific exonuclease
MSFRGKKWVIKNKEKEKNFLERLLINRGMTQNYEMTDFYDPFLFKDMEKTVERIMKAVVDKERIIIFGDYDVDGLSGAAILMHTLNKLGATVSCRIPNRMEDGYGLSEKFIEEFIEKNIKLIITVDCGISGNKPISKAKEHGIETIITDHHTIPKEFPQEAFSVIHPKLSDSNYPFSDLTGAGVALKLAQALMERKFEGEQRETFLESLLDLAAMGTVADLGPLLDENRLIVKRGLERLKNTKWAGIKKLKKLAKIKEGIIMNTSNIGYHLAPRINAAGRIGDPYIALLLLLQKESGEKTNSLGDSLENLNVERQKMTEIALQSAEDFFPRPDEHQIFIAQNPDWHVGILGLIAGRLAEKHGKPAIIMQDLGDILTASARSPHYFNVIEAITHCKEHLMGFGGHAQAGGFSIKKENLKAFKEKIIEYTKKTLKGVELKPLLEIDFEINPEEINFETMATIEKLEPFGVGNQRPIFLMKEVEPLFIQQVGKSADHIKFQIRINGNNHGVIGFGMGGFADKLRINKKLNIAFHIERNKWNNREEIQLQALDFSTEK